jgi:Transposase DDE domain group 1
MAGGLVSQAGVLLLAETLRAAGLGQGLSAGLAPWRAPRAVHDPGKILTDLVVTLALGGDCLADVAALRAEPELCGPVASDPVISRLVSALAVDAPRALRAIRRARAAARERAWMLAGDRAPGAGGAVIPVDIDATIVAAQSENEQAPPTWKKTFGFHPLAVLAGHGAGAGGEALGIVLRPGNAGSNTASEHIEAARLALAQLPGRLRQRVLIRTDSGGGTHEFLAWLAARRLHYSVGMTITDDIAEAILTLPDRVWESAYDAGGQVRPGASVAKLTGLLDLSSWPEGMRVIIRRERPHPGAQLRVTDLGGHRFNCFATSTKTGQLADLELRHRRRARCEDRIRAAKDTGLRNLPLQGFDQNQIWCELVAMACELTAWMQMLALDGPARAWEPKRLRLRLFSAAGRLVRGGRRLRLRLAATWPWATQLTTAITRLQHFAPG